MIRQSDSFKLSTTTGDQRFTTMNGKNIQKVKQCLHTNKREIRSKTLDGTSHFREKCSENNEKRFRATCLEENKRIIAFQ